MVKKRVLALLLTGAIVFNSGNYAFAEVFDDFVSDDELWMEESTDTYDDSSSDAVLEDLDNNIAPLLDDLITDESVLDSTENLFDDMDGALSLYDDSLVTDNMEAEVPKWIWELDAEGTLSISGEGNVSPEVAPWINDAKEIKRVIFGENITHVGSGLFTDGVNLKTVVFQGEAPEFEEDSFRNLEVTIYHPELYSWTQIMNNNYGGIIEWVSVPDMQDLLSDLETDGLIVEENIHIESNDGAADGLEEGLSETEDIAIESDIDNDKWEGGKENLSTDSLELESDINEYDSRTEDLTEDERIDISNDYEDNFSAFEEPENDLEQGARVDETVLEDHDVTEDVDEIDNISSEEMLQNEIVYETEISEEVIEELYGAAAAAEEELHFAGGLGTNGSPFLVHSAEAFNDISKRPEASYKLTANIKLKGYSSIPSFSGRLNGNGYTITVEDGNFQGLINTIEQGAVVQKLFINVNAQTYSRDNTFAGAVCSVNNGTIRECLVSGNLKSNVTLNNSYNYESFCFADIYVGGICGKNCGTISYCRNDISITANHRLGYHNESHIGGIAGYSSGLIEKCLNAGAIAGVFVGDRPEGLTPPGSGMMEQLVGGIAGKNEGTVNNCATKRGSSLSYSSSFSLAAVGVGFINGNESQNYTVNTIGGYYGSNCIVIDNEKCSLIYDVNAYDSLTYQPPSEKYTLKSANDIEKWWSEQCPDITSEQIETSLSLDNTYKSELGKDFIITAKYKSEIPPNKIEWTVSDPHALKIGSSSVMDPVITDEEGMYWISTTVSAMKTGEFSLSLDVNQNKVTTSIIVEDKVLNDADSFHFLPPSDPWFSHNTNQEYREYCLIGKNSFLTGYYENSENLISPKTTKEEISKIKWSSSDETVAEIISIDVLDDMLITDTDSYDNGLYWQLTILGHKQGEAILTGISEDGRTTSMEIKVEPEIKAMNSEKVVLEERGFRICLVTYSEPAKTGIREFLKSLIIKTNETIDVFEGDDKAIISVDGSGKTGYISFDLKCRKKGDVWYTVESPGGQSIAICVHGIRHNLQDSDGDGLPDDWETNGLYIDVDGREEFVDLPAMGANPMVRDIFVEVDWMEGCKPSQNSINIVCKQFKNHGINLHVDMGSDSVDYVTGKKWGNLSKGSSIPFQKDFALGKTDTDFSNWKKVVDENFSEERKYIFRHCLFVNKFNGSDTSGIANDIPGQTFIVASLEKRITGNDRKTAGTFMHELGHTLGLRHGGSDHVNNKPNYLSVMNYLFQLSGLVGTNEINYSEYELPSITEYHINENYGIDPYGLTQGKTLGTKWYVAKDTQAINQKNLFDIFPINSIARETIDFNKNGIIETDIQFDINGDGQISVLSPSVNDWERISFTGGTIGYGDDLNDEEWMNTVEVSPEELVEMSYDEAVERNLVSNDEEETQIKEVGICGESVTWCLDTDGVLTISGVGDTFEYGLYNRSMFQEKEIKEVFVEEGVTSIGAWMFWSCGSIEKVSLPSTLKKIGDYGFYQCSALNNVTWGDNISSIGYYAFRNCYTINKLTFPKNLGTIGDAAFSGCSALKEMRFIGNLPEISNGAFSNVTAVAYYPSSWLSTPTQQYGGTLTWKIDNGAGSEPIEDKIAINNATITGITTKVYTGKSITQSPTVKIGNTVLKSGVDYSITYENNVNVGTAKILFKGSGNYTGTISKTFTITALSIGNATISGLSEKTYTGKPITQSPTVKVGDVILRLNTDYSILYENNVNVGTATIKFTGIGNYTGNVSRTFTIIETPGSESTPSLSNAIITGISDKTYTGFEIIQVPTVQIGGKTLRNEIDYEVTFKNNFNPGTATITITGKGDYCGSISKQFKISNASSPMTKGQALKVYNEMLSHNYGEFCLFYATDDDIPDMIYRYSKCDYNIYINGKHVYYDGQQSGGVYVGGGDTVLVFSYFPRKNFIKLVEQGYSANPDYYRILPQKGEYDFFNILSKTNYGIYESYMWDGEGGHRYSHLYQKWVTSRSISEAEFGSLIKSYSDGDKETACTFYKNTEANRNKYILNSQDQSTSKISIAKATVTGITDKEYTGKPISQIPVVKIGKTALKSGTNYSVSYKNNTNIGTATVTISGKGNYTGTLKKTFKIIPKSTTVSKLTGAKKKITIKWKKQTKQTTGYQIQYSIDKNFKSGVKAKKVKGAKKTSVSISKLKAKTTYYVRIRTYRKVGGKTYYSSWSKAKKTKTK